MPRELTSGVTSVKPLEFEFMHGPRTGERIVMNTTVLHFGRIAPADVKLDWDRLVSSEHFLIRLEDGLYILEDLGSRNGTRVNSKPVRRWQLADGDRIQVGSTELLVLLERLSPQGLKPNASELSNTSHSDGSRSTIPIRESLPSIGFMEGLQDECGDGLVRIKGAWPENAEDASWIQLFSAREEQFYAILDASRSKDLVPLVATAAEPRYFFDWFPEPARTKTPVFVSLESLEGWQDGLMDGWDCDAIILMRSSKTASELFDCLKHLMHYSEEQQSNGKGMLGVCWPSILQSLLISKKGEIAEQLYKNISMLIIENGETPMHWQLFAREKTIEPLLKTKIRVRPTEKSTAGERHK